MTFNISIYSVDKLGRHAEIQPGFAFKSERFTDDPSDVALVKGENVQQGFIDWNASKYWPAGDAGTLRNFELRVGDVVLAMDRPWVTAGLKWAYIKKDDPRSLLVQRVARLRAKKGLDQNYLRCLVSSDYFSNYLQPIVTGVNVPHISGKQIGDFKIPLPSYPIQQKIAAIISTYDELIDNNQRRIALLEKMAEEIYREWFVRLRFPGHEKVKKVKGVPEGWRAVLFTEVCEFQKGKAPDQIFFDNQDGLLPYITVEFMEGKNTGYVLKKGNSIVCENGDVLMLMDGARSGLVFRGKKGIVGSTFARIAVEPLYRDVVYEFLRATHEHIVSNNTGSAIPHANKEFIHRLVMFLPENENLIEKFNVLYRNLFEQMLNLARQKELLLQSRDALLPRLISGKLSVEHLDIQFPPGMEESAHAN